MGRFKKSAVITREKAEQVAQAFDAMCRAHWAFYELMKDDILLKEADVYIKASNRFEHVGRLIKLEYLDGMPAKAPGGGK